MNTAIDVAAIEAACKKALIDEDHKTLRQFSEAIRYMNFALDEYHVVKNDVRGEEGLERIEDITEMLSSPRGASYMFQCARGQFEDDKT